VQIAEKLFSGQFYHIYNRGNNSEDIFIEDKNYQYFFDLWGKYIVPIAETYSYCLMRNHFHFLVRIRDSKILEISKTSEVFKTSEVWRESIYFSRQFSNLFNAYAKAINKRYNRTGSLFQTRFGRKRVTCNTYLFNLVQYIHFNPQHHGFVDDFREYPYSTYYVFLADKKTNVACLAVLYLFGDNNKFINFHDREIGFKNIRDLIEDDF